MFDQVLIIGCGLIGSSIFKRLKKNKVVKKIITYDKDEAVTQIIKDDNLSDEMVTNLGESVKGSDLIIISTPISSFESVLNLIKDKFKPGSILTDTCSVKKGVNKIIKKISLKKMLFGFQLIQLLEQRIAAREQVLLIYFKIDGLYLHQVKI